MCTVLLRINPGTPWPLLLAAVRDEFVDRSWDPPAEHWSGSAGVVGGRDRTAGGTWLAVDPHRRAVAALLNGVRLPMPESGVRPSRGGLPLSALATFARDAGAALAGGPPELADVAGYDGFHLLLAATTAVTLWSWNGVAVSRTGLEPGEHIVVNAGADTMDDPLVPHFLPLLTRLAEPPLSHSAVAADAGTEQAWGPWVELLRGDGLAPDDPRALLVRHRVGEHTYGSTSATLVALGEAGVRYDFTATPDTPQWSMVALPG